MDSLIKKSFLYSFLIYGLGAFAQNGYILIQLPFLIDTLSTTEFGAYNLILFVNIVSTTLFYLGITSALPRTYFNTEDTEQKDRVITSALSITLLGGFSLIFIGYIFSEKLSLILFDSYSYSDELMLIIVGSAFWILNSFFLTLLRVQEKAIEFTIINIVNLSINCFLFIIFLYVYELGILSPIYSFSISNLVVAIYFLIKNFIYFNVNLIKFLYLKELLYVGFPIVLASFFAMGIDWSERVFIGTSLSLKELGIYALAFRLASLLNAFLSQPFVSAWNPIALKKMNDADIDEFLSNSVFVYCSLGALFTLLLTSLSPYFLYFVEEDVEFLQSLQYVPFLAFGLFVYGLGNIFGIGFFFKKKTTLLAYIYGSMFLFCICFLYLTSDYIELNAAVSFKISVQILLPILMFFCVYQIYPIKIPYKKILHLTPISICFLFNYLIEALLYSTIIEVTLKILLICFTIYFIYWISYQYMKNLFK